MMTCATGVLFLLNNISKVTTVLRVPLKRIESSEADGGVEMARDKRTKAFYIGLLIIIVIALGFCLFQWNVFYSRVLENIAELRQDLQTANMGEGQIRAITSSLLQIQSSVSSYVSSIANTSLMATFCLVSILAFHIFNHKDSSH